MLPSKPYLYQSVISCSKVLKFTKIKPITNNHYYAIHVTMANQSSEYSGIFFKNYEIKQCCHFLVNTCKIFKMLIERYFFGYLSQTKAKLKRLLRRLYIYIMGQFLRTEHQNSGASHF